MRKFKALFEEEKTGRLFSVDILAEDEKAAQRSADSIDNPVRLTLNNILEMEKDYKEELKKNEETIERLKEEVRDKQLDIETLEYRIEKQRNERKEEFDKQKYNRIGDLKAMQTHLMIIKDEGHTHQRKNFFTDVAIRNLEQKINSIGKTEFDSEEDLPF